MKILIVDDEHLARERLHDLVSEIDPDADILQARNGLETLEIIKSDPPDIILLDIRMPVMDGLETASHLARLESSPAVVFTTAYQDHAIDAFNTNALDYLLKPIRKDRLIQALQKAKVYNRGLIDNLRNSETAKHVRTHLSAVTQGKIELIPVDEIRYLKADQKYVAVGRIDKETLIDESLKSLEDEFRDRFLRVHRNALIALDYVESMQKDPAGSSSITIKGINGRFKISRRHQADVRSAIKKLGL